MGSFANRNRLTLLTIFYWFLLAYILAALVWWFIELWRQNTNEFNFKMAGIAMTDPYYGAKTTELYLARKKKESQFIGEGIFFLLMTMSGAVFVYRSARHQMRINDQQRRFMTAVTHELKTPIAITKLNLETLRNRKLEGPIQEKLIGKTLEETNRLNDLCNNILLTSQLDVGDYRLNIEDIDLGELASRVTSDFRQRFPRRTLLREGDDHASVRGDFLLLQLALNNLVENALKYSPPESPVTVSLHRQGRRVQLGVTDLGNGIPDSEKKLVFEKFYRMGDANTPKTKGTGLGLWLSQRIAEDHGADLFISDNQPKGCIFVLDFQLK
jgi:two-component system sensor histidine kinase CiaH